jgi:hypothetical protein
MKTRRQTVKNRSVPVGRKGFEDKETDIKEQMNGRQKEM